MAKASDHSLFLLSFHLFFAVMASLATAGGATGDDGARNFAACLVSAGVQNYTFPSSAPYVLLLDLSLQNLRFATPHVAKPAALVLPSGVRDLRGAVLCCRASNFSIRIRSGGHSYEGLSYSVSSAEPSGTPFVVVDLMNMNRVRVERNTSTAWVETGSTIGETYYALAQSSATLGFPASSCPTVGIGGHISGGGFGMLSRKYGLAADNVVDAILIDSEGRVMDRAAMGEDVFWGIRGGGGGGWGAIYAWKIRLLPVPKRVAGFIVERQGATRSVAELVHKWQLVAPSLPDEFFLSALLRAGYNESADSGRVSATFKGLYLGPVSEAVSILAKVFPELGVSVSDCHDMSWIESTVFLSDLPKGSTVSDLKNRVQQKKTSFKAKSDYVRDPISVSNLTAALYWLSEQPKAYIIMDPYGGAMARISSDELPFPHRGGNLYSVQYVIEWTGEQGDEESVQWMRRFYESMSDHVSRGPRAAFANYFDLDLGRHGERRRSSVDGAMDWGEKYFLGNFDRLVRAKTIVDPDDVFSNAQSIPPLPKAASSLVRDDDSACMELICSL